MKKFIYLLSLFPFLLQANTATDSINILDNDSAKYAYRHLVAAPVPPDSADAARLERKAFWRASAETAGFNIGLWAFDRYVQKGHYAYINWNTIKANFKHGFEWDNDHLNTNMFAHPYNGSLYFNAGRSNGYNFWQSELFAIGGSAMWEMFMECEYPSTNDIIATPVGGAAIGEVLYRTSDLILDDRTTGGRRFGRELAAFLVSPMRGFTRIVTGRAVGTPPHFRKAFRDSTDKRGSVARHTVTGIPRCRQSYQSRGVGSRQHRIRRPLRILVERALRLLLLPYGAQRDEDPTSAKPYGDSRAVAVAGSRGH